MSERDDESQKMASAEWIALLNAAWREIDDNIRPLFRANLGSRGEAEEAVHEAYLRMRNRLDPKAPRDLKAYAYAVAKRVMAQRLQKSSRRQRRLVERFAAERELRGGDENAPSLDGVQVAQETVVLLAQTLDALPAPVRLAYEAFHFDGEPVKSIAARLGIKEHKVYQHLNRAHEQFAKALASAGQYP